MKQVVILFFLLALCTIGCNRSEYVLKGHVSDTTLYDRNIFLCDAFSDVAIDTTTISQDGSFEFSGNLEGNSEPFIARLSVEFSEVGTVLIIEPGTIVLNIDFQDGLCIPTIKGTPLNDEKALLDSRVQVPRDTFAARMSALETMMLPEEESFAKQQEYISDYIKDFSKICNDVFTKNNNNVVGLFALLNWSFMDQNINMDSLLNCCGDVIRESEAIKSQVESLKKLNATQVGKSYIDITGINQSGNSVSLSEYVGKGKLVLLDFWASWCEPCKAEIPNLARIAKKYEDKVTVVGVNVWDQVDEFHKAYSEEKIFWPQIIDINQQEFTDTYAIDAIPVIMLIDNNGVIVARGLRGDEIQMAIDKELAK